MRISLRVSAHQDAIRALAIDPVVADACDLDAGVFDLNAESEILDRVLRLTRRSSGLWLNPWMIFTKRELDSASFFQLECRGKLVQETKRDYEWNSGRLEELEFTRSYGNFKIKIIDRIAFSNIKVRPNAVGCAGHWMAEFIVGAPALRVLEAAGLTGLDARPVLNPKTGDGHEDFYQLYSHNIMPPVVFDATTLVTPEANPDECHIQELGCLTYDLQADDTVLDFNRTAEDWSSNYMPLWVVSSRVRDAFLRNKLRGLAFRPVLEKGSELHKTYLEMWGRLIEKVKINPRNKF